MQPALRHQLRTPLNQIRGYAEMLLEDAESLGAAETLPPLQAIVETVKDLTRETASKTPDLTALASQLVDRVSAVAARKEPFLGEFQAHMTSAAADFQHLVETPVAAERPEQPAPPREASPQPETSGDLLVVDDNARNREVLGGQLQRQGYSVRTAATGQEALDLLREYSFDAVLLDVWMPGMDGFQTLDRIKRDSALCEIPVIMISASDDYRGVIRCIESGAEDYLPKPFDPVLLRARLKASLEKKALRRQLATQEKLASLGALAAGIAHEIKNPLNFVTNFASLSLELTQELRQAIASGDHAEQQRLLEELDDCLKRIGEHGKRADRTVGGMLMHSRKQPGGKERADVNALAAEALKLACENLRARHPGFHAETRMNLDPAAPQLEVFPQALGRVFLNLASNGLDSVRERATAAGPGYVPRVALESKMGKGYLEIRFRDNGMGVAPGLEKKIFEPFFTTKPGSAGTGLGLSISHDIVIGQHSGQLTLQRLPGEETAFVVTLPTGNV